MSEHEELLEELPLILRHARVEEDGTINVKMELLENILSALQGSTEDKVCISRKCAENSELLEALEAIGGEQGCFCDMKIGHPLAHGHSDECSKARAAIAKARGEKNATDQV